MNWGVDSYNRWRESRIKACNYNDAIFNSDLKNVDSLTAEQFSIALCYFMPEVVKQNDELYPAASLYQLVVAIQKYVNFKKIFVFRHDSLDLLQLSLILHIALKKQNAAAKSCNNCLNHPFFDLTFSEGIRDTRFVQNFTLCLYIQ